MSELRNTIERIRFDVCNTENRHFVPEASLSSIVTETTVKQSLKSLRIPLQEINDVTADILRGARKCFAILLLIGRGEAITSFIKHDSLQQESSPDYLLPYTSEHLRQIFKGDDQKFIVKSFLEKQWEFAIPIMRRHTVFRELDTSAILPFLNEEPAGRGSMGTAWKVTLHPHCHRLPLEVPVVVRKEIECKEGNAISVFQRELENLALLTHLKHDNIIQLYCAYMYRQRFNFVFAFADGGPLTDLLNGKSTKGPKGSQLLLASAELASAIDALHNFTAEALDDLKLSGCHHDLAPRNILIHKETFLLADFGLSSLRNAEEDSLTLFKDVRGSYLAPECQPLQDGHFVTGKISRASDIWSFGCILSEILTYMRFGPEGVHQFRNMRNIQVTSDLTWPRFHGGSGRTNPAIELWLNNLAESGESYCMRMITLIRRMLSMEPGERPSSMHVLGVLRGIWIVSFGGCIKLMFDDLCKAHSAIDCLLNYMRFAAWLTAFDQLLDDGVCGKSDSLIFDFPKIAHALKEIHVILKASTEFSTAPRHDQHSLFRYQHARLTEAIPLSYKQIAKEGFEELLLRGGDAARLGDLSTAIDAEGDKDLGVLIAVKHLTTLANNGCLIERGDLIIDQGNIALQENVNIHNIALIRPVSELVLVEWLRYQGSWVDEVAGRELRRRLSAVIELLHAESTAKITGSLRCRGMFHDPSHRAFGVVYDVPPQRERPITLYGLLQAPRGSCRPLLEYRFQLALDICQCIYTFHKVGWLHRNLHSMNVLFFPSLGSDKVQWAKDPRIVGFAGSRESGPNPFTYGPEEDQLLTYQHPEYLTHQARYREAFDYYSIGILLLEIGLWSTLAEITKSDRFQGLSHEELRQEIISHRVSHLGIYMGTRYMEATRLCLDGSLEKNNKASGSERGVLCAAFKNLVIGRISIMD